MRTKKPGGSPRCGPLASHTGELRNNRFKLRQLYAILRSLSLCYEILDMLRQWGVGAGFLL